MLKKILLAALWLPLMALAQTYPSPTYQNVTILGTLNVTGGPTFTSPVPVASGGTGRSTASGTSLDNITGFASTGFMSRTGAGAYSFTASTGSGNVVLATSPVLTTPNLGTPSAVTLTNGTGLPISTGVSGLGTGVAAGLANAATGSGSPVLASSPTLVTPALGTPSAAVLTNATGLPLTTGVTGQLPIANGGTGTASPALVAGNNITLSGSWPNNTINSYSLPVIDVKNQYASNVANAVAAANAAGAANLYFAGNTTYTVSSAQTLGANVNVICDPGAVIQTSSATADIFDMNGSNTVNRGCSYSTSVLRTGGDYVKLIGTDVRITDFLMTNAYNGVEIDGTTAYVDHGFINSSSGSSVLCTLAGDAHVNALTSNNAFTFSGYISGTTLTVTTANSFNTIGANQVLSTTPGASAGTMITALGTGTGGVGTYTVNNSQTLGSAGSPILFTSSGSGIGVNATGDGGGAGCALTLSNSGILQGSYSAAMEPAGSGDSAFLLVTNTYLDNAALAAALVTSGAGGSAGYLKIANSEIGPNGPTASGVNIAVPASATLQQISIDHNTIYNYTNSTGSGVLFSGGAIPSGATISNNTIGVVGGLFDAGISLNYSGNSNVLATGNILKANGYSFYISNTSDVSCLISNNRLVTSTHVATGCNQNNNY